MSNIGGSTHIPAFLVQEIPTVAGHLKPPTLLCLPFFKILSTKLLRKTFLGYNLDFYIEVHGTCS